MQLRLFKKDTRQKFPNEESASLDMEGRGSALHGDL